ncbi:MAG TPA: DUF1295 domain-containing protein [Longimicrobiales bacterium]|nr:DUF1295 domain-containing protein [Longimicrobiales bacterium]
MIAAAIAGLGVVVTAATLLWLVSLARRDASIADPFWAPGFLVVLLVYVGLAPAGHPRQLLVLLLVGAWAGRLGLHLLRRNLREGEDPRYAAMRREHGARFGLVSLVTVFWLQAALLWIVSAPLLGAAWGALPLGPWDLAGAVVAASGIVTEAVADRQLRAFRRDPDNRGRVLSRGLWRYSRHPNYFGNAVLWWGLWLLAVGAGAAWTALGPALMTFLLVRVSGVPMLEASLRERRPGYEEYVRRTSAFLPWPPREG